MKTVEASTIHEGIENTTKLLSGLADQVADVQGKIAGILHTESVFSGQAASSIRAFYKDIHVPLAVYLEGIVRNYHDTLRQIQQMLYELDRSEQAMIEEDYLNVDVKSHLKKTKEQTEELNDEVNHILRSVRDLIHLSALSDDEVLHSVETAEKKVNKTIESVHQFDEEATHKLKPIKNDVNLLENYLHDIQSLTKNHQLTMTSYQANAIKQLDVHQQMIGGLMQKAIPKEFALDLLTSLASSSYLAIGDTLASIVRAGLDDTMSMTMNYRMRALATIVETGSPMSEDAFNSIDATVVSSQSVRDYKGEYFGNYLTLQDGRIVRSFLNQDGVMKYHFVESIPEDRLKPVEEPEEKFLTRLGNGFKKMANSTVELGKDTVQGFGHHLKDLNANKMNSFYDFANYATIGALDAGKDTYDSMVGYKDNMLNSPADFANWITMGGVDLVKGAVNPDDPNSKEHIAHVISMGMFMFIRKPGPKTSVSTPNNKPSSDKTASKKDKDSTSSTVSNNITYNNGKLPTLTNIREWFRTKMPEIGLVQDSTGAYHLVKMDGNRSGKSSDNSNTKNSDESTGNGNIVNEVKEIDFGKHIIKGENGKKQLHPNTKYVTNDNYKYTTDELGRIVNVDAPELVLKKANRNKYAQANVGGKDRLTDDDGGHLVGAQFNGPPDIDNLVPQNSQINRRGGVWYEMETEWANALKEVPPKKVSVSIEPIYSNNSMRPYSFMVEYEVEGQFPVIREIANKSGG
ncbi:T7SS effector LXG polymorphic toxin [Oceanobacillus manasiensis]|uniref:T7SS effector LXG polymorphic toxin n=1 Tax=Oceanobacillus manasiensis TaxID=586413 RepID=UPI000A0213CC|nr:T7SS effector LXG polymorphic toxin [Oceanobacillus manasiensis]